MSKADSYQEKAFLSSEARAELKCWKVNLYLKKEASKNSISRDVNSDGCFEIKQKGSLSGSNCTSAVVTTRAIKTHKFIGVNCSKIYNLHIHSREVSKSQFANRKCTRTDLLSENRGYQQQGTFGHSQGNLGL